MPRTFGSIQICRKCVVWFGALLNSLCWTPRPALMRCTSPGRMMPLAPPVAAGAEAVAVCQLAVEDVADDLHVAVAVRAEAAARSDPVLVDDAQVAEAHVARIVVVGEREAVLALQPAVIGVAPFGRFAQGDHSKLSLRTNCRDDARRCGRGRLKPSFK